MKHPERVEDYLEHMAEAITRATRYIEPLQGIEAFRQNQLVQDGVVRNIEIIGEAANHINRIAPEFVAQHPELPWPNMRNIIIHAYFNVDYDNRLAHRAGGFAQVETADRSFAEPASIRPIPRTHSRLRPAADRGKAPTWH